MMFVFCCHTTRELGRTGHKPQLGSELVSELYKGQWISREGFLAVAVLFCGSDERRGTRM